MLFGNNVFEAPYCTNSNFVTDFRLSVSDMFYKGTVSAQGKTAVRKMNIKV